MSRSKTFLRTRDGIEFEPYDLIKSTTAASAVDVYLVHRGPDTKHDVIEPVAYVLKCLGVQCFADTQSQSYSMPLGEHKLLSMKKGLSFCLLLSEGFCDSHHCVKEVNTILLREDREDKTIMIPALYTGSLQDVCYAPVFGDRSTFVRRSESAQRFARALVEKILLCLQRSVPDQNLLKFYLNEYEGSVREIDDPAEATLPSFVDSTRSDHTSFSSLSTQAVLGSSFQWKRPFAIPRQFLQGSMGREQELADLHRKLSALPESTATVRGVSVALRGPAGMGKTVAAALYAERYGSASTKDQTCYYPGGVMWLTVGQHRKKYEDAAFIWQQMVHQTFPELLLRENEVKDGKQYEADEVRNLLAYRPDCPGVLRSDSPLLVVLDDVWSEDVLLGIQEALPLDCRVLVTTRDSEVAFALEDGERGMYRLDTLSERDALDLLMSKVKDLPDDVAKKLAQGMGYHAQALTLAAGTLSSRRQVGYRKTASKILDHLANGKGFGRLPRSIRTTSENRTVVEKALDASYECLESEDSEGLLQQQFRALGVFAQEAEFSTAAAAFVWKVDEDEALDFLVMLETLALVNMVTSSKNTEGENLRWQQHAVLRAYEQSLWTTDDDNIHQLHSLHSHYFADLVKQCMKERPRDFERIDTEFRQIQHAFIWSREESSELVQMLATSMSKYLMVRGLVKELESWLNGALEFAKKKDHAKDRADLLRTVGDIQLQMGRFDRSRQNLDHALRLFDDIADQSGRALTLHSIGDVEYRLGKLTSSREYFCKALTLFRLTNDTWGIAVALRSLGDVQRFLGNAVESREYLSQAITLFAGERDTIGEAGAILAMGRVESRVGMLDDAQIQYERALTVYKSAKSQLGQGSTLKCMGDICLKKAELKEATRLYKEALPLFVAMSDQLGEAHTLRCMGDIQVHEGSLVPAEEYLTKALQLYRVLRSDRGQANSLRSLAELELRKGNSSCAESLYMKAKLLFESIMKQLWQNDWECLDQVEYELQSMDPTRAYSCPTWTLEDAIQQPIGNAQTLDILSEVER